MSVIIRLQGLSWSASAMDIRNFFKGLSIPPGGVRIIGGEKGDAFIAFSTDEDARQAMMLTNTMLNDTTVQLFLSSKTEMQNTIAQAKDRPTSIVAQSTPITNPTPSAPVVNPAIPSVQQISQMFPAVGQIIGSLGLQTQSMQQKSQFTGGFPASSPADNLSQMSGYINSPNINSTHMSGTGGMPSAQIKANSVKQFEDELPGEYSVGGMASDAKRRNDSMVPYGQRDSIAIGDKFPPNRQPGFGGDGQRDRFLGQTNSGPRGNQSWSPDFQRQFDGHQNLNQNNQSMPFSSDAGHGKPFQGGVGDLHAHQYGHGKPLHSDQNIVSNQPPFPGSRPRLPTASRFSESFSAGLPGTTSASLTSRSSEPSLTTMSQHRPGPGFIGLRTFESQSENSFSTQGQTPPFDILPKGAGSTFQAEIPFQPDTHMQLSGKSQDSTANAPNVLIDLPAGDIPLANMQDVTEASSTPTLDEKMGDSRSIDRRSRDTSRMSSRDRDRSRDRSSRRDSPRDRDRRDRERDRSRKDKDDDRRHRRDRDRDRDRDRRPRDRDSERSSRTRDSNDRESRNSPSSESVRRSRKRSLSPASKSKTEKDKKVQLESSAVSQSPKLVGTDKQLTSEPQPLFPVVPLSSGKTLLGEGPNVAPVFISPVQTQNLTAMTATDKVKENVVPGKESPGLLGQPASKQRLDGTERHSRFDTAARPPSLLGEKPQAFEYGHAGQPATNASSKVPPFDQQNEFGDVGANRRDTNRSRDPRGPQIRQNMSEQQAPGFFNDQPDRDERAPGPGGAPFGRGLSEGPRGRFDAPLRGRPSQEQFEPPPEGFENAQALGFRPEVEPREYKEPPNILDMPLSRFTGPHGLRGRPGRPPGPHDRFGGAQQRPDGDGPLERFQNNQNRPDDVFVGLDGGFDGPPGRLEGPPGRMDRLSRFEGQPGGFEGRDGPPGRFDGPPARFGGPPGRFDGPPVRDGPPGRFNGPPGRREGPPGSFDGPSGRFDGPPGGVEGPPGRFNEPFGREEGALGRSDGPGRRGGAPERFDGPQGRFDEPPSREGPLGRSDGHPDIMDRSQRFNSRPGILGTPQLNLPPGQRDGLQGPMDGHLEHIGPGFEERRQGQRVFGGLPSEKLFHDRPRREGRENAQGLLGDRPPTDFRHDTDYIPGEDEGDNSFAPGFHGPHGDINVRGHRQGSRFDEKHDFHDQPAQQGPGTGPFGPRGQGLDRTGFRRNFRGDEAHQEATGRDYSTGPGRPSQPRSGGERNQREDIDRFHDGSLSRRPGDDPSDQRDSRGPLHRPGFDSRRDPQKDQHIRGHPGRDLDHGRQTDRDRERRGGDREDHGRGSRGDRPSRFSSDRDRSTDRDKDSRTRDHARESRDHSKDSKKESNRQESVDKKHSKSDESGSSAGKTKQASDATKSASSSAKSASSQNESQDSKAQKSSKSDGTKSSALCSVVLENIPVETTYKDIRRLFAGLDLPKDGIKLINDKQGRRIGKAYVRFGNQDSFKKGLLKDKTRMGAKVMTVKLVPRKEFDEAIDSYTPSDDEDEDAPPLDMANSLSAALRVLKGEPSLKAVPKKPAPSKTTTEASKTTSASAAPVKSIAEAVTAATSSIKASAEKTATKLKPEYVVKITMLPEYTRTNHIISFFKGCQIARHGEAIFIESSTTKPCTGLCFVEFASESSYKRALSMTKVFDGKTINMTTGSKKDIENLVNKMKDEVEKSSKAGLKPKKTNDTSDSSENANQNSSSKNGNNVKKEKETETVEKLNPSLTCLRVRNIPKSLRVFELRRFFDEPDVVLRAAQICHDAVGKAVGEGFVEFASSSDTERALVKNNTNLGANQITVEPVSKQEMIEDMRLLRQSLQPDAPTLPAVFFFVKASNLPKNVSTGEIMNFFSGYNPAPESIRLNIDKLNDPPDCSSALIGFRTRGEAELAIDSINGNILRNKNVTLTKVIV